jgi:hypothetical protein
VVRAKQTHETIERLLPRNEAVSKVSITKEDGVFREVSAEDLSWRQSALGVSQLLVGDSHGKFAVEEKLEVGL